MSGDQANDSVQARAGLEGELEAWQRGLRATLDDAMEHLQELIFDGGWEMIRATVTSDEEALRASVGLYEERLADLFRFVRLAGVPESPLAWSELKAELRRAAQRANLDITLRTALDQALYAAEATPLGDHGRYRVWVTALLLFLRTQTAGAPPRPADADEQAHLGWAYTALAPLEEHEVFNSRFQLFIEKEPGCIAEFGAEAAAVAALQVELLAQPRFDLVLNAALRWLAGTGTMR